MKTYLWTILKGFLGQEETAEAAPVKEFPEFPYQARFGSPDAPPVTIRNRADFYRFLYAEIERQKTRDTAGQPGEE